MSDQSTREGSTEVSTTDGAPDAEKTNEHVITKSGTTQYSVTYTYDEESGDLVAEETELLDDVSEPYWVCSCGEHFVGYPGALSHAELYCVDGEAVR